MKQKLGGGGLSPTNIEKFIKDIDEATLPDLEANNNDGVRARSRKIFSEALRAMSVEYQRSKEGKFTSSDNIMQGMCDTLGHCLHMLVVSVFQPGTDMAQNIADTASIIANVAIEIMEDKEGENARTAHH